MDINEYLISRKLLEKFFSIPSVRKTLVKYVDSSKTRIAKQSTKEKSLIYPHTDNYLQSPDYFFLKCKRENYKDINIRYVLERFGLDIYCLKESTKDRKESDTSNSTVATVKDKETKSIEKVSFVMNKADNVVSNREIIKLNQLNNPDTKSVVELIKGINVNNINEYTPKNFRIIMK
jgi:hypothetical protein